MGRPVPLVPHVRRRSSDDLARVAAEEQAAQREADLLVENTRLSREAMREREERERLEKLLNQVSARMERVEKTVQGSLPPPRGSSWHRLVPHLPAIIIALTGLVTGIVAAARASSTAARVERTPDAEQAYDKVRSSLKVLSNNDAQSARDLGELRKYQERIARENTVQPAPRSRSKAPAASSTGADLPPPVPRVMPTPVDLPPDLDDVETTETE